jgi:hypothetical protein
MPWNKSEKVCLFINVGLPCHLIRFQNLITKEIFMFKTFCLTACTVMMFSASGANAAPADDARTHFQAIGSGDLATVMRDYANSAQFNWVGGPLDGTYNSPENIRVVWEKFTKSAGPLKVSIDKLEESANPKGSTVSANVQFEGKAPIKVRYVLTFREGKIVSETWQIDPKLAVASSY